MRLSHFPLETYDIKGLMVGFVIQGTNHIFRKFACTVLVESANIPGCCCGLRVETAPEGVRHQKVGKRVKLHVLDPEIVKCAHEWFTSAELWLAVHFH